MRRGRGGAGRGVKHQATTSELLGCRALCCMVHFCWVYQPAARLGSSGCTSRLEKQHELTAGSLKSSHTSPASLHEHVPAALEVDGGVDCHADGDGHHEEGEQPHAHRAHSEV